MTACPKQSSPAVRAGVYTRISSDSAGRLRSSLPGTGLEGRRSVLRQRRSPYGRKPRQAYERMLAAVESGSIHAIVTWHNDRLHRSPKELEAFIDLVERTRVNLAVVTGGADQSGTPPVSPWLPSFLQ